MSILTGLGKERKSLSDLPIHLTGFSPSSMYINILIAVCLSRSGPLAASTDYRAQPFTIGFLVDAGRSSGRERHLPGVDTYRVRKVVAVFCISVYGECMARMISTTIRLNEEDVRALKRARAAGHSASELVRKGLRVVASRYYAGRRPPSTLLFESTDAKLGDESELFQDVED
jgi:Arc/MetJ-type ribon-helix-helix transcriptional regulator